MEKKHNSHMVGNSPITVGRYTYGFENISVGQAGEGAALNIGQFCSIAKNVRVLLGANHRTDWITTYPFGHIFVEEFGGENIEGHPCTKGDVEIGNDVWIGEGVTILSGVKISDGSVLAANATVTKDVLPYEIVGGNPAIVLKKRFDNALIDLLLKLSWWDLKLAQIREISEVLCSEPTENSLKELIARYR